MTHFRVRSANIGKRPTTANHTANHTTSRTAGQTETDQ
jgi:hypothetical protein